MSPEQWQKVSTALDRAQDLTAMERGAFLLKLRHDDPTLCREVESLLEQYKSTDLFDSPPADLLKEIQPTNLGTYSTGPQIPGELPWPKQAGRFVIREEIARGGMGAVLRAFDPDIQRTLALKIVLSKVRTDSDQEWRFVREARITGRLQHPGVPPVHELGRLEDGRPFFAMKLIVGRTLAVLLGTGTPADAPGLVGIFEQICQTLAYSHSQGILHRDLKPSNVMVGAFGEVQVMDWGLAKEMANADGEVPSASEAASLPEITQAGNVSGTPAYMAPEQARGEVDRLDERCDVFGLGGILCAILTRRPPFYGSTADMVRKSAAGELGEAFALLDQSNADPALIAIARKCLAPQPTDRYRHAGEVADAVTQYREGVQEKLKAAELAREKAQVQAVEERRRRRLTLTLAVVVLLFLVGAGSAGLWYQHEQAQAEQDRTLRAAEQTAQKKYLEREIGSALDKTEKYQGELHGKLADPQQVARLLSNLDVWRKLLDGAAAAHENAVALAGGSKSRLDPELTARLEKVTTELAAYRKEFQLAQELDEIRMNADELLQFNPNRTSFGDDANRRYTEAFAKWDLDPASGDPAVSAKKIQGMQMVHVIVAALDHWANAARNQKLHPVRKNVIAIARLVDSDPWRDQVRDPNNWATRRLEQLAKEADVAKLSPQFLAMMGWRLSAYKVPAAPLLRRALVHHPNDFWLHFTMGFILTGKREEELAASIRQADTAQSREDLTEIIASYRTALALRPESNATCVQLAWALSLMHDTTTAAAYYERALALNPNDVMSHVNLGVILADRGELNSAISHYRRAVEINPGCTLAHLNLSGALKTAGDLDGCIRHSEKAIELDPKNAGAMSNLGNALSDKGDLEEACNWLKKAVALEPCNPIFHNNLGSVLQKQMNLDEAIVCYQEVIKLNPQFPQAYVNLAMIYQDTGAIAEAHQAFKKGHQLGSKLQGWPDWIGPRVKELERPAELDKKLPAILAGRAQPKNAAELMDLADLCRIHKRMPAAAAGLFGRAFAMDAKLPSAGQYRAACSALAAASGDGKDVDKLNELDKARLRQQALTWLQAQAKVLQDESLQKELLQWRDDPSLASVRDPQLLAKLPAKEQQAWQEFWAQLSKAKASRP